MWRILLRLVVLVPAVVIAAVFLWLRSSLPVTQGRLTLAGLSAEVRVDRDMRGIPTITAANDRDAAFALGFVHAQDRLFQMDILRHVGAGRLSEWFGTRTLGTDRFLRTLGLYHAAEQQYARLSPQLRATLDAYAQGVNAYLATRLRALPPEYYLLSARPEPWRAADTLVWGKLMDLQLAGNFRSELLHARMAAQLKPEELAVLYPPYPKDAAVTLGSSESLFRGLNLAAIEAVIPDIIGPHTASDNWVVDGKHTISGKPLLANDPHLPFAAPSVWYLVRIETPELKLAGVSAPGGPFVILGHNDRIAWGFTNTGSDVEDLFIEQVDPENPLRYLAPDGPRPFGVREETIYVRGAPPVKLVIRTTRHGPVISDENPDYKASAGTALALQTTWLMDDDRSPEAFWAMERAGNWEAFRGALKDFAAPQQNIVYADTDGTIGFIAPAYVPIRAKGDGWAPVPGWSGDYDWVGFIPFDQLPMAVNPPSGRLASANNRIVGDTYPYFLGYGWDIPNRFDRINQLLDMSPKQSPDLSAAMQADTLSLMAKDLLPLMLPLASPTSPTAIAALDELRDWDGRMQRERAAPLIFTAWLRELNRVLLADKLGLLFESYWDLHPDVIHLILTQHRDWCDDRGTAATENCTQQVTAALERTASRLREQHGPDVRYWRWGSVHAALFTNQFWSNVPLLRDVLGLEIPANGGYDTLDRGATSVRNPSNPYADVHGATLRMIVDFADIDATRFMITPGQSGNPLSSHYRDLMQPWRDFAYITLDGAAQGGSLVLAPP